FPPVDKLLHPAEPLGAGRRVVEHLPRIGSYAAKVSGHVVIVVRPVLDTGIGRVPVGPDVEDRQDPQPSFLRESEDAIPDGGPRRIHIARTSGGARSLSVRQMNANDALVDAFPVEEPLNVGDRGLPGLLKRNRIRAEQDQWHAVETEELLSRSERDG